MCGLVGFSGNAETSIYNALHLLGDNDDRGGHSSGLYANKQLYKAVGDSKNIFPILNSYTTGGVLIGHTRYATHGEHTVENAHPYQYDNVVGAHNGVIKNYEEVGKRFDIKKTTVDSQMIFKVLSQEKKDKHLGLFYGAKNVLYTKGDNRLYVYRRDNPLFKLETPEGVYFSSEDEGLEHIAKVNKLSTKVKEVVENKLFVYENGKLLFSQKIKHKPIESVNNSGNTNWKTYVNDYNYIGGYNRGWDSVESSDKYLGNTKAQIESVYNAVEPEENFLDDEDSLDNNFDKYERALEDILYSDRLSVLEQQNITDLLTFLNTLRYEYYGY